MAEDKKNKLKKPELFFVLETVKYSFFPVFIYIIVNTLRLFAVAQGEYDELRSQIISVEFQTISIYYFLYFFVWAIIFSIISIYRFSKHRTLFKNYKLYLLLTLALILLLPLVLFIFTYAIGLSIVFYLTFATG